MEVARQVAMGFHPLNNCLVFNKFFEKAAVGTAFIVGMDYITKRDGLGAVLLSDPIGVGKIDADRRAWSSVARLHDNGDGLSADSLYFLLFMLGLQGRIVFEPLSFVGDGLNPFGGFKVAQGQYTLKASFNSQCIVIDLYKPASKIDHAGSIFHPGDIIFIPLP